MGKKIPGRKKKVQGAARRTVKSSVKKAVKKKRGNQPRRPVKKRKKVTVRRPSKKRKQIRSGKQAVKKRAVKKRAVKKRAVKKRAVKKRAVKKPAVKKRAVKKPAARVVKKRKPPPIIPKSWRKLPPIAYTPPDLERMAAQIAQRIGEKIVGGGHAPDSIEAKILMALIAAEQIGRLNREFYLQAGEYDGYDTPQEVYELWIYSGA